jgi:hypothetical protein
MRDNGGERQGGNDQHPEAASAASAAPRFLEEGVDVRYRPTIGRMFGSESHPCRFGCPCMNLL